MVMNTLFESAEVRVIVMRFSFFSFQVSGCLLVFSIFFFLLSYNSAGLSKQPLRPKKEEKRKEGGKKEL